TQAGLLWLCKGFQGGTGWLGHEVARVAAPDARVGVLSGPSFAIEVARGQPTALVAASGDASLREAAGAAFPPATNARAALSTRGLAEMPRLGVALGAEAQTFMGLSGLGDLVLTTIGDLSRNRRVGLRLAEGVPLARIV